MDKKIQERIYAEKAIELLKWKCQLNDIPEPLDFEVSDGVDTWGLEIRNVFKFERATKGSRDKEYESHTYRLLFNLAREYYAASGSPIRVQLRGASFLSTDHTGFLSALLDRQPGIPGSQEILQLASGVTLYICDLPVSVERYSRWQLVDHHVGWVRPITQLEIQKAIDVKATRLPVYSAKYQRIDLLLVADRIFNSARMSLASEGQINNPGFANIYFLSYPDDLQLLANKSLQSTLP
jgi:hypothetical protein